MNVRRQPDQRAVTEYKKYKQRNSHCIRLRERTLKHRTAVYALRAHRFKPSNALLKADVLSTTRVVSAAWT